MPRYDWSDEDLAQALATCVSNQAMAAKLKATSAHMMGQHGPTKAAALLDALLRQ